MSKLNNLYKMVQTVREQAFGAKAVRAGNPDKNWSLKTLRTICCRVDETGSFVTRSPGKDPIHRCRGRAKSLLLQLVNTLNTLYKY